MATPTIKNLPDESFEELRERAAANRRSINGEAIVCLEQVLRGRLVGEADLVEHIRALREQAGVYLTEDALRASVGEGRIEH